MSLYTDLQARARDIDALARKYGATNLRLFGSAARGEETDSSDIDILAEFEPGRSYFDLIGLQQDLEFVLNRPVDIVTPDSLHAVIKDNILKEAQPLSGKSDG